MSPYKLLPRVLLVGMLASQPLPGAAQSARGDALPDDVSGHLEAHRYEQAYPGLLKALKTENQQAQFTLANYYVCGRVVPFDCSKALELFVAASKPSDSKESEEIVRRAKNEIAWIYAACEDLPSRNLAVALVYASQAASEGDPDPYNVDTLAAVHARKGDFDKAIEAQRAALFILEQFAKHGVLEVEPYTFDEFRRRLALYQARQPATFGKATALQNCNTLP